MAYYADASYGIIPLQERAGIWCVFLIQHRSGHWSFPKGHADHGERAIDAAIRELREESGLEIDYFIGLPPVQESYTFQHQGSKVDKTVTYYPATVKGEVVLQQEEVSDFKWVPLLEAENYVTFSQVREICRELIETCTPEILTIPVDTPEA